MRLRTSLMVAICALAGGAQAVELPGRVVAASGREGVSQLFRFEFEVQSSARPDPADQVGRRAELELAPANPSLGAASRSVDGLITRFENGTGDRYYVVLEPRAARLRYRTNSRIFQEMGVPDIVSQIFGEHGVQHTWMLNEEREPRSFTAQYQESDWNFVSRLLADEGFVGSSSRLPLPAPAARVLALAHSH